ncbi:hypothetical protein [Planococcus maritimus]|uniref:hypothetical protein n=1 Tax=Planococcus maritimus TaxID=192421 RepID=UPI00232E4439|nr:hypothetical protein [Planococcus maritimus]
MYKWKRIKLRNRDIEENLIFGLTFLGIILIAVAIVMPFIVRIFYMPLVEGYNTIGDLGAIGDYIGGTTVAFLTAASVILLLATIIMQRKEIKISQQSIEHLVEQTRASIDQAEEARKETQITNETMKRQQFETTFFNMVSLHHSSTEKLISNNARGREVLYKALQSFGKKYYELVDKDFKKLYIANNYQDVVNFIMQLQDLKVSQAYNVSLEKKQEVIIAFKKLDFDDLRHRQINNKIVRDFFNFYHSHNEDRIKEGYTKFMYQFDRFLNSHHNSIITILRFLSESDYEKRIN